MAAPKQRPGPLGPTVTYRHFALQGYHQNPSKIAVIEASTGEKLTYSELEDRIHRFAGALQTLGIGSQSKVQFFAGNSLRALIAREASLFCNATTFLFKPNKTLKYEEYKYQVEDAGVELVITDAANYDITVHKLLSDPECTVRKVILLGGSPRQPVSDDRIIDFDGLDQEAVFHEPEIRIKEDILVVSYTSGSTGRPKGVMHSNYSLTNAIFNMGPRSLGYYLENDRFLLLSTLTYVSGMMFACGPLSCGGTVILASHDIDNDLPLYVERYQATVMFIPEMTMKIATSSTDKFPRKQEMLASLRVLLVSGTLFPGYLRRATTQFFGGKMFQYLYGSTEAIGMVTGTDPMAEVPANVGFIAPNVDLRLVDDDGNSVPIGVPGEVQWKAPQLTLGYWNQKCEDFLPDGFYATGDMGVIDSEGRLSIVGRKKYFIICLDERISPGEIEDTLFLHPGVDEAIVVGTPHQTVQEAPTGLVVLKKGFSPSQPLANEMVKLIASKLSNEKHLYGGVHFVDSLEKTESGKYARGAIAKLALTLICS